MSIRKPKWKSPDGVEQTARVVNYTDQAGTRRLKTFDKKKSADDFDSNMRNEVRTGIHTPDSSSIAVGEAGDRWLTACENAGLERTTVDAYRSHP
jgi:integrase